MFAHFKYIMLLRIFTFILMCNASLEQ